MDAKSVFHPPAASRRCWPFVICHFIPRAVPLHLRQVDQRLLTTLGKGNYEVAIESDGRVFVNMYGRPLRTLESFRGLPIDRLEMGDASIENLEPLRGMQISKLGLRATKVSDLAPLAGMPLRSLSLDSTPVRDFSPLSGLPLTTLVLNFTKISAPY